MRIIRLGLILACSLSGAVAQVSLNDDFNSNTLNTALWSVLTPPPGVPYSVTVRNQRLEITGVPGFNGAGLITNYRFAGDFDVQVDYMLLDWPAANNHSVQLGVQDLGLGTTGGGSIGLNRVSFVNSLLGVSEFYLLSLPSSLPQIATTQTAGTMRLVRTGAVLSGYANDGTGWRLVGSGSVPTAPTRINIDMGGGDATASSSILVAFDNFMVNSGTPIFPGGSGRVQLICRPVDPVSGYFGSYAPLIARHCYFLTTSSAGEHHTYGAYGPGQLTPLKDGDFAHGQPKIPAGCTGPVLGSDCIEIPILKTQTFDGIVQRLEAAVNAGQEGTYDRISNNSNGWVQRRIDALKLPITLPPHTIATQADLCRELDSGYLSGFLKSYGVRFSNQVILFYYGLFRCAF